MSQANLNFDSFLDTIRSNKPPFNCPVESCNKSYRKYEDIQQHLQDDSVHLTNHTQINRKGRLRKSIKNDICPPKVRVVEFKYNSQVESLPITTNLKVNIIRTTKENINDHEINTEPTLTESKCKSSSKFKIRSKLNKVKNESSTTNNQTQLNLQLPEPSYRMLNSSVHEFKEPNDTSVAYYRYLDDSVDEDDQINVEYDMDEEDSIWLDTLNCKRRNERLLDVSADTFELMMDRLEKESFFQSQHNGNDVGPAIDEDAVCSICNDGECQNSNAILFCDMCNLAVHQECYGVPYIPEGQWLCRRCMQSPSRAVDCVLCPNKGGAFKQTDDNRWAHVICALWIPEVCFANTVFLEPIDSIIAIPTARWRLACCVCHQKNSGACIQCHKSNCYVAFHVTCAQQAGLYMKIEAVKEVTPQGLVTTIRKTAYCFNHAPASKNGASNGIYSSGDEESRPETKRNEKIKDKIKKARRLLAEKRSSIPIVSIPTIPIKRLTKIAELISFPRRNDFLIKLYAYWKLKRQSRNGVPLLRRLQNSNSTMRIDLYKEKSKRDNIKFLNQYKKLVDIRRNLEKARLLLELIRKREKTKIQIIKESRNATIYKLAPFRQFLLNILQKVVDKDVNQFFLEPVSTEEVPDYLNYIKIPMDLGTMRKKVEHHEYVSFQDFENDLNLIVENCMIYNEKETIWHKAALKLRDCIKIILNECRPFIGLYNQKSGIHKEDCPDLKQNKTN